MEKVSSRSTRYGRLLIIKISVFIKTHPKTIAMLLYVCVSLLASYVFYLRFPHAFHQANFYAEDTQYAANIIEHGVLQSLFIPFNGYFIVGIYLMHTIAFAFNSILFGDTLLTLPQSISVISYLFLGFSAALPVLLLRRFLRPIALAWLVAITVLVPVPLMDYGILGNTANLKFVFPYIALLLIIYRHYLPDNSKRFIFIDCLILLCCLTNIITVALLPFMAWRYVLQVVKAKKGIRYLVRNQSFISLLVFFVIISVTLLIVAVVGEVKPIGGIYDRPFEWQNAIEIFFGRSFLFGFSPYIYGHLSNFLAASLTILFIIGCIIFCRKRYRSIIIGSVASILLLTGLLIINRPGISTLFDAYNSGGYDQYFFVQNIIAYLAAAFALSGLLEKSEKNHAIVMAITATSFLLLVQISSTGSLGVSNFMAATRGTFVDNVERVCAQTHDKIVTITAYPQNPFVIKLPRDVVCKEVSENPGNSLAAIASPPSGDALIFKPGISDSFTQTFASREDNLRGVAFFVATYEKPLADRYRFTLLDEKCEVAYYTSLLNNLLVTDGSYYPATFPRLDNSKNTRYCFKVEGLNPQGNSPFAIRLTRPQQQKEGRTIINRQASSRDVVFLPIY